MVIRPLDVPSNFPPQFPNANVISDASDVVQGKVEAEAELGIHAKFSGSTSNNSPE